MQHDGSLTFDARFLEVWTEDELRALFGEAQSASWNPDDGTVCFLLFSVDEGLIELEPSQSGGVNCFFLWADMEEEMLWPPEGITTTLNTRPGCQTKADNETRDLIWQLLKSPNRLDDWSVEELD